MLPLFEPHRLWQLLASHMWNWYCRAAKPEDRMEAIASRAMLLAAVG
jgi:hypothetical protein